MNTTTAWENVTTSSLILCTKAYQWIANECHKQNYEKQSSSSSSADVTSIAG